MAKNIIIMALLSIFFMNCSKDIDNTNKKFVFKDNFECNKKEIDNLFNYIETKSILKSRSTKKHECINADELEKLKENGVILTVFNLDLRRFINTKGSKKLKDFLIKYDKEFLILPIDPNEPNIFGQKDIYSKYNIWTYCIGRVNNKWTHLAWYNHLKSISKEHTIFLIRLPKIMYMGFFDDNGNLVVYDYLSPNHIMKEDEIIKKLQDPLKFFKSIQKRDEEMSIKYKNEK